jgi:hypothetical protein
MRLRTQIPILTLLAATLVSVASVAKEKEQPKPVNWVYAPTSPVEVRKKASSGAQSLVRLERGALLPVFELKRKGRTTWARVRGVDPAVLTASPGWVDTTRLEMLPADRFPPDAELLKALGGTYIEDFTAERVVIARFLARRAGRDPLLVCLLGSPAFPTSRLQVFLRASGKPAPGPFREFAFADMRTGIIRMELRDLLGDGDDLLLTREPFRLGLKNEGVDLVIQRIEDDGFKTLWKAPLEFHNLASFPPKPQMLEPPERNIGLPGTVTQGSVEFRTRGRLSEPYWKGKVELHVIGREQPLETQKIEKLCAWDGTKFAPLQ